MNATNAKVTSAYDGCELGSMPSPKRNLSSTFQRLVSLVDEAAHVDHLSGDLRENFCGPWLDKTKAQPESSEPVGVVACFEKELDRLSRKIESIGLNISHLRDEIQ